TGKFTLQQWNPQVLSAPSHRSVQVDSPVLTALDERNEGEPDQQRARNQQQEQRVGVCLFELGVIGAAGDQLGDPALDEDADVVQHLTDCGAACGQVVGDRPGCADAADCEDRPEQHKSPVRP